MRKFRTYSLLATAVLLTACAAPFKHDSVTASPVYLTQQYDAQPFNRLVVRGNAEVVLNSQLPANSFSVSGYATDINHLSAVVKQQTFYLTSKQWSLKPQSPVKIMLNASQLAQIDAHESAKIIGNTLRLNNLQIQARGNSQIILTGAVNFINVILADNAHLDARSLQVKQAYINTTDAARADVNVSYKLNAFASGNSNIYYYRVPALLSQYMRNTGSVLNMVGIDTRNF
jgi:hypothetical protein